MQTVSLSNETHRPLTRLELAVALIGALAGGVGYALDVRVLDYIAVLCAVSSASLLLARVLQ